jgi:hypothetical protein
MRIKVAPYNATFLSATLKKESFHQSYSAKKKLDYFPSVAEKWEENESLLRHRH